MIIGQVKSKTSCRRFSMNWFLYSLFCSKNTVKTFWVSTMLVFCRRISFLHRSFFNWNVEKYRAFKWFNDNCCRASPNAHPHTTFLLEQNLSGRLGQEQESKKNEWVVSLQVTFCRKRKCVCSLILKIIQSMKKEWGEMFIND